MIVRRRPNSCALFVRTRFCETRFVLCLVPAWEFVRARAASTSSQCLNDAGDTMQDQRNDLPDHMERPEPTRAAEDGQIRISTKSMGNAAPCCTDSTDYGNYENHDIIYEGHVTQTTQGEPVCEPGLEGLDGCGPANDMDGASAVMPDIISSWIYQQNQANKENLVGVCDRPSENGMEKLVRSHRVNYPSAFQPPLADMSNVQRPSPHRVPVPMPGLGIRNENIGQRVFTARSTRGVLVDRAPSSKGEKPSSSKSHPKSKTGAHSSKAIGAPRKKVKVLVTRTRTGKVKIKDQNPTQQELRRRAQNKAASAKFRDKNRHCRAKVAKLEKQNEVLKEELLNIKKKYRLRRKISFKTIVLCIMCLCSRARKGRPRLLRGWGER